MERAVYRQMAEFDERHWWYCARRTVLGDLIRRKAMPPSGAQILEIGCGTGHNLPMLGAFGNVDAAELDDEARAIAERRLGRKVASARLPELAGIRDRSYDLVAALDVIEHIEDDRAALQAIAAKLKKGGKFLMTVPAHQWMWSAHDVANHHKRRYSKASLKKLVDESPLKLETIGYFNSLLFPLAVVERLGSKLRGKNGAEVSLPPRPINSALRTVFALERYLVGRLPLPPGLSLFAFASAI
jgi:SAM-dependent methyltransferase